MLLVLDFPSFFRCKLLDLHTLSVRLLFYLCGFFFYFFYIYSPVSSHYSILGQIVLPTKNGSKCSSTNNIIIIVERIQCYDIYVNQKNMHDVTCLKSETAR